MLSYRQIEILYLLIHEQTFIPINTIANQLGVSPRTIQYDIAYIEQYAETYHYQVSCRHQSNNSSRDTIK